MDRRTLGWLLRGAMLVLVFGMALSAFCVGVGVSDRPGLPDASFPTKVYYCLGLFVLGGVDLGTPIGGPVLARVMLWMAYFMAPLITTSAVVEGALRLIGPAWFERRGLRNHVVIVGVGRLGTSFLEALRELEPDRVVVAVDRDLSPTKVDQTRRRFRVRFMAADVRLVGALEPLSLHRAHAVVLLTDDDLVNLEAAWRVKALAPDTMVVAHVADIAMQRAVSAVGESRVAMFNSHRVAARHLYEDYLRELFAATGPRDTVVLAGFGRFGQTILEFVEEQARGELARVVIVDKKAAALVRGYRQQVVSEAPCELSVVEGDIEDPQVWEEVEQFCGDGTPPIIVLGCDDERVNIRGAIQLRAGLPESKLFVRSRYRTTFTEELSERFDFRVLAVHGILREALRDHQVQWFGRA